MKKPTPKVGDLIAYNGAGMLYHSLGLVVEVYNETANRSIRGFNTYYRIQWAVVPSIPPRKEWSSPKDSTIEAYSRETMNNHSVDGWYKQGGWFVLAPQKK